MKTSIAKCIAYTMWAFVGVCFFVWYIAFMVWISNNTTPLG